MNSPPPHLNLPETKHITISYAHPGTIPPVFIAGTMTVPPWQPREMAYSIVHEDGSSQYHFSKEFRHVAVGKHQYKFRIGHGDSWAVDRTCETVLDPDGHENNLLNITASGPGAASSAKSQPKQESKAADFTNERATIPSSTIQTASSTEHLTVAKDFAHARTEPLSRVSSVDHQENSPTTSRIDFAHLQIAKDSASSQIERSKTVSITSTSEGQENAGHHPTARANPVATIPILEDCQDLYTNQNCPNDDKAGSQKKLAGAAQTESQTARGTAGNLSGVGASVATQDAGKTIESSKDGLQRSCESKNRILWGLMNTRRIGAVSILVLLVSAALARFYFYPALGSSML